MSPLCLVNYPKKQEKKSLWESFLFILLYFAYLNLNTNF